MIIAAADAQPEWFRSGCRFVLLTMSKETYERRRALRDKERPDKVPGQEQWGYDDWADWAHETVDASGSVEETANNLIKDYYAISKGGKTHDE
jgi:hypothetical protein